MTFKIICPKCGKDLLGFGIGENCIIKKESRYSITKDGKTEIQEVNVIDGIEEGHEMCKSIICGNWRCKHELGRDGSAQGYVWEAMEKQGIDRPWEYKAVE